MDSLGPNELALAQVCQHYASSLGFSSSLSCFSSSAVAFAATTFEKDKEVYAIHISNYRNTCVA
jgi:hypothetical protein